MKNNCVFFKLMERRALFYISANLFNFWLNRRQLDAPIPFCIQSVVLLRII